MKRMNAHLLIQVAILLGFSLEAGKMLIKRKDGARVMELLNGVRVTVKDIVVTSPMGLYYEDRKVGILFGGVELSGPGYSVMADTLRYYELDSILVFNGSVLFRDSTRTAKSSVLVIAGDSAVAEELKEILLLKKAMRLQAEKSIYHLKSRKGELVGNPVAYVERKDTFRLTAEFMFTHGDTFFASKSVIFTGNDIFGKSNDLTFTSDDSTEKATMRGSAVLVTSGDSLAGDTIVMYFKNGEIDKIEALGNAELRRSGETHVEINAGYIEATISENKLKNLRAEDVKEGLYVEVKSDSSEN